MLAIANPVETVGGYDDACNVNMVGVQGQMQHRCHIIALQVCGDNCAEAGLKVFCLLMSKLMWV